MNIDEDVCAFARVQAALASPFADRDALLAAAGLDEDALRKVQARWTARLASEDADALRQQYGSAFALHPDVDAAVEDAAVEAPAAAAPAPPEQAPVRVVPSYLQAEALATQPSRDVTAGLESRLETYRDAGPDATLDPFLSPDPTLPFVEGPAGGVPAAVLALKGSPSARPEREPGDPDETQWISVPTAASAMPVESEATAQPLMALEKYARFLALFGRNPDDADALRAQFGIASPEAQQALGRAFAQRFAADPAERERFAALIRRVQHGGGQ